MQLCDGINFIFLNRSQPNVAIRSVTTCKCHCFHLMWLQSSSHTSVNQTSRCEKCRVLLGIRKKKRSWLHEKLIIITIKWDLSDSKASQLLKHFINCMFMPLFSNEYKANVGVLSFIIKTMQTNKSDFRNTWFHLSASNFPNWKLHGNTYYVGKFVFCGSGWHPEKETFYSIINKRNGVNRKNHLPSVRGWRVIDKIHKNRKYQKCTITQNIISITMKTEVKQK